MIRSASPLLPRHVLVAARMLIVSLLGLHVILRTSCFALVDAQSVVEVDPLVITDIQVTEGSNETVARAKCLAVCPCQSLLTNHIRSPWRVVGGNLRTQNDRGDGNDNGPPAAVLCIRQERFGVIRRDPGTIFVMQSVQVVPYDICPSPLRKIYSPRRGVSICIQPIAARIAVTTGMYVSDLATGNETSWSAGVPGWVTVPTSAHVGERTDAPRVFISYRRPVRPIVAIRTLSGVTCNDAPKACWSSLGAEWEQAGNGLLGDTAAGNNILCVKRASIERPEAADAGRVYGNVLTDVAVVDSAKACGQSFQTRVPLSKAWSLCGAFGDATRAEGGFIGELMLQNEDKGIVSMTVGTTTTTTTTATIRSVQMGDLNVQGSSRSVFLRLRYQSLRTNASSKKNGSQFTAHVRPLAHKSTGDSSATLPSKPPLMARLVPGTTKALVVPTEVPSRGLPISGDTARATAEGLTFKVLQLADLHMTGDPDQACRDPPQELAACGIKCTEALTTAFVEDLLDSERPDLVVLTGDNVQVDDPKDLAARRAALAAVVGPMEARKVPYAAIFGNHDDESGWSREAIAEGLMAGASSYMERGPRSITGVGNYALSVRAPVAGPWGPVGADVFRLYFLDSNAYVNRTAYPNVTSEYDWIHADQIDYYRSLSNASRSGGAGGDNRTATTPPPAIMFFHIPIPEYALTTGGSGGNGDPRHGGEQNERVSAPSVNSGLLDALAEVGEVKATFAGHDHVNDFCNLQRGVQLCYGGAAGMGRAYGSTGFRRRARVIEWRVGADNRRRLVSWKRHFGRDFGQPQQQEVLYERN